MDARGPGEHYCSEHVELLLSSYQRLTQKSLLPQTLADAEQSEALFEAPFAVVSHSTDDDPIFNYGNRLALQLFEMDWQAFTHLPSRLSAEPMNRFDRQRLLERVSRDGFIDDYQGVRISSSGQRFLIEDATVWNLVDEKDQYRGQAAAIFKWQML